MCIGAWALDCADYALILCSNRDEFLNRPTEDAHFHSFGTEPGTQTSDILSGRDVKAGGTWFGINRAGRVALLTNITEPPKQHTSSRGYLVSSFLLSDSSRPLEDEVGKIIPQDAKFAGFNLLLLAPATEADSELAFDGVFVTNNGSGGTLTTRPLTAQERPCGAFSNGIDGEGRADWPKVEHAAADFDVVLQSLTPDMKEAELTDRLFELLAWRSPEPVVQRSDLRKTVHVAPIPITVEGLPKLTADFYGTRLSTILLIRKDGQVLFIERDIWKLDSGTPAKTDPPTERIFRFQLDIRPQP